MNEIRAKSTAWWVQKTLFVAVVLALVCVTLSGLRFALALRNAANITMAQSLEICASARGDRAIIACTRTAIDKLLATHTTSDLMRSISFGRLPPAFYGCHSVGHIIGTETFKKTGDLEKTLAECTNDCSSACVHGALGAAVEQDLGEKYVGEDVAHADIDTIKQIGEKYCTNPALCHGMGHILFINTNDFLKSVQGCGAISSGYAKETCEQGVFMQGSDTIATSLVLSDNALTSATQSPSDDYGYPCDTIPQESRHACYQYLPFRQSALLEKAGATDPKIKAQKFAEMCATFQNKDRAWCFEALGKETIFGRIFTASIDEMLQRCGTLEKTDDQKSCVIGRLYTFTQFDISDEALQYCSAIDQSLQTTCFNVLFQFDTARSLDPKKYCQQSGTPTLCETAFKTYSSVSATLPNYRFGLYGEIR